VKPGKINGIFSDRGDAILFLLWGLMTPPLERTTSLAEYGVLEGSLVFLDSF